MMRWLLLIALMLSAPCVRAQDGAAWFSVMEDETPAVDSVWDDLIVYYSFDVDGSDSYIYSTNSTLGSGATITNDAMFGNAVSLDKSTDSIVTLGIGWRPDTVPAAIATANNKTSSSAWYSKEFSFSMWVKIRATTGCGGLFGNANYGVFGLLQYHDGNLYGGYYTSDFVLGSKYDVFVIDSATETNFVNYVCTMKIDGTTGTNLSYKIYKNGVEIYATYASVAGRSFYNCTSDGYFQLGQDRDITTRKIDGIFDEVAIWNRACTSNEVYRIYSEQLTYP